MLVMIRGQVIEPSSVRGQTGNNRDEQSDA